MKLEDLWRVLALASEAASLTVWLRTATQPGRSQAAVVALGLALSWLAARSLSTRAANQQDGPSGSQVPAPGAKQHFFGWALRLHRCLLPYVFPPADSIIGSGQLPVAVRLGWLLLVKSGAANVAAVSLALQQQSGPAAAQLLLLEQAVLALLLAKRAPAICVAAAAHPELQAAAVQLQRWLPLSALAGLHLAAALLRATVPPGLGILVTIILVSVAVVPIGRGWWQGLWSGTVPRPHRSLTPASLGAGESDSGSDVAQQLYPAAAGEVQPPSLSQTAAPPGLCEAAT